MTELAYVTEYFDERFRAFRDASILLHGSREYAREIVRRWGSTYRFCGIASFEPVSPEDFPGLPVIPAEEIWDVRPDMILLTERVRYAEAAYQSLHRGCRERGVALYDMYGLDEIELHRKAAGYPLASRMKGADWEDALREADLVVFEAVETVLRETGEGLKPRPEFPALVRSLEERGASVAFSLRKSVPVREQADALRPLLGGEEEPAVFPDVCPPADRRSTFLIRRTGEDLSLRLLREAYPGRRILYVGCGLVYEHILPQYYGLDVWRYMDQYDCLAPILGGEEARTDPAEDERRVRLCREAIRQSDAVSFDVFDTLLLRRVLRPQDVFALTERRLREAGCPAEAFAERRAGVQRDLPHGTAAEIYAALRPLMGWTESQTGSALEEELRTEKSVLCPRREGTALLEYARSLGREILLVSDMYFPEPVVRELLDACGIRGPMRIFVSCDWKKTKREGLFEEVRRQYGGAKRIVHFGDEPDSDGACEGEGIRFIHLPRVVRLAAERGWRGSLRAARTLEDSCLLGTAIAAADGAGNDRAGRLAAGVIGPILAGYTSWLIANLRKKNYDAVLFFARDGWLFRRLYEETARREDLSLPRPVYFYTSRHASVRLHASDPEVLDAVVRQAKGSSLSGRDVLTRVFGFAPEELLPARNGESMNEYVRRHEAVLLRKEQEARRGLRRYVESLGLGDARLCAVCDFFASGTTQRFLEDGVPFRMEGYYAGNYKTDPEEACDIRYFFSGACDTLFRNYIELEGFFTSPEPSLDRIGEDGAPVFAEEPRDPETREEVRSVQERAMEFARDFFARCGLPGEALSAEMVERMYEARDGQPVITMAYNDLLKEEIGARTWERGPEK